MADRRVPAALDRSSEASPAERSVAPAVDAPAPPTLSPAGLLALQQGAGNAAVARMLAARDALLQRDETDIATADPPARPLPSGFEWIGSPEAPQLLIERAHLERFGIARGTLLIEAASNPALFRPLIAALLDRYPWTAPRRDTILEELKFSLELSAEQWEKPQMEVPLKRGVFKVIGLPPDAPVQVYFVGGGIEIYVDLATLNPTGGDPGAAIPERVLQKLEEAVRMPVPAERRAVIAASIQEFLTPLSGVAEVPLPEAWMLEVFGEKAWRERLEASEDSVQGGTVLSGGPGTFELSPLLSKEDEQFVKETIEKLFGKAKGGKASRVPLRVFTSDVEALRRLAKDPERLERLAALLYFGDQGESARHTSFADLLETADEALDIQENARRLGVKLGSGPPDQEPIDRRPVRGDIVNKTGELVPKQAAHFEFETRDKIDAFRVPMVNVRWVAVEKGKGGARIDSERNRYIEIRPDGIINDRVFEVTFPRKGVYEVHAFVDHNFYLPGHFVSAVEVRTEQERLKTMDERSGFGRVTGSAPKRFKGVEEEEGDVSVAAGLFGAPIDLLSPPGRKSDYAAGRRMTGVIDPDVMAVEGGGVAIGLTGLDEEIRQVEQLRKDTEKAGGEDKAAMLKWIDDRLEGLRGTHKKLTKAKDEPGTRSVLTQGSYVARTNKVRGGPLTLVSWFTHDPATGTYHAHLLDHSQLVRAEDFHFQAKGTKYEEVMERLFFELTKTYPDGSMTFAFQKFDGVEPTDRFVRFERKTDTALNDVRDVLYSEEASLAVSIFSLLLMIFPPTALAGITIGVVYNTAQALDSYAEAERTGTLKTSHKIELALAALSVLPAARGANIVRLGGRTYRVISVVERAGEVFLLAQSAEGEIRNLRDSQITDLAKLHDEIQRRKRVNASDEDLRKLEYRADRLRDEIRNASLTVLEQMGKSQLLQMAPGAAINAFAARRRGGADADVDDPARRPQPDDPAGTTDPAKRGAALGDPVLAEGLPAGLRRQVAVERDESVHDSTVRVHYDLDDNGLVRSVTVKAGRSATPDDIRLHARTVELMLGYRGLSGTVRDLLGRVKAFFTGDAPPPPVGSRAWEAKLEIDKLPRVIKSRMKALESGADEATAAKLRAEIAFLDEQLARHKDTFDRLDLEAGAGFVAAEKDHHAKAVAAGYPSLDKAEGHFYEPDGKGGYALRQRADSAAPPLELSEEGGKRTLRKGSREPIPGLDLDQTELRRVLEVMSAGQATALAEVFSPAAVQKLARGGADGLRQALRAHERIVPLLSDPAAAAGVERLARGGKMGIDKILTAFNDVPETNLRDLMRVLGDEKWTHHPHSMGAAKIVALGRRTTELRFIARFGIDVYNELRTDKKTYGKMLATLPDLDDVAAEKLVRDMLDAGTPLAREQIEVLKIKPRPKPRRTSRYARADTSDEAGWPEYLEKARKWMTEGRAKHLTPRDGKVDVEAAIEAHAAIEQIKDKVNSRWEAYQKLPYEARVRFLEDIDDIGRQGGLYNTWVSNARGAVAERLFAPGGGLNQKRIENPLHPAIDKQGKETTGYTRLDGFYEPGRRKGSTSGQKEWVEVKSDEIGMPGRDGKPNAAAVATARRYAADGLQDWHALLAHQSTREDGIVIQFAKKPADEATKQAMLKELFATNSPFAAVGFGDEWHERPAGRALPPKPPELEDGPIRGVPAGAAAGG